MSSSFLAAAKERQLDTLIAMAARDHDSQLPRIPQRWPSEIFGAGASNHSVEHLIEWRQKGIMAGEAVHWVAAVGLLERCVELRPDWHKGHHALAKAKARQAKEASLCNACEDRPRQVRNFPCRHATMCGLCTAKTMDRVRMQLSCSMCRANVADVQWARDPPRLARMQTFTAPDGDSQTSRASDGCDGDGRRLSLVDFLRAVSGDHPAVAVQREEEEECDLCGTYCQYPSGNCSVFCDAITNPPLIDRDDGLITDSCIFDGVSALVESGRGRVHIVAQAHGVIWIMDKVTQSIEAHGLWIIDRPGLPEWTSVDRVLGVLRDVVESELEP